MKTTYPLRKRLPASARPVQIIHDWEVISTVEAENLPDALKRWYRDHSDEFTHPLVTGNTLTVRSVETGFDFHVSARDVPGVAHSVGV